MTKRVVELKCYDVLTNAAGEVGVVLPNPSNPSEWSWWYGEGAWNPVEWDDNGNPTNGNTGAIVSVHRQGVATDIAFSICCNHRQRWNTTDDLALIWKLAPQMKLGEYEAKVVGAGDSAKLRVGCQTITYEQAKAAYEALEKQRAVKETDSGEKFEKGDIVTFRMWAANGDCEDMGRSIKDIGCELPVSGRNCSVCWSEPHYFVGGWTVPQSAITLVRKAAKA